MIHTKRVSAIITAAGRGKRMRTRGRKQFQRILKKPVLAHTIERFESSDLVDEILISGPTSDLTTIKNIVKKYSYRKVVRIVRGGRERQDSVLRAFRAITRTDIVLVHDGVRPFITPQKIDELIELCSQKRACILAVLPREAVRRAGASAVITETLDRQRIWLAQTPQAFQYNLLKRAFERASRYGYYGTDEAMLVEKLNQRIHILEGEYTNLKITTPEDISLATVLAEKLLKP